MALWTVGQKLTAARLNAREITNFEAACDSDLTAGTSGTLSGTTITITTLAADVTWKAWGTADFDGVSSGTTTVAVVDLELEGVDQSGQILCQSPTASSTSRDSNFQQWSGTLAVPATYTFRLAGTAPSGGVKVNAIHSKLGVQTKGAVSV